MSQYVDQLLREWARWKARQDDAGLGFPSEVSWVKERVQESRSASDFRSLDPEILRVDAAILRLPGVHRQVVILHYTQTQNTPIKTLAARQNMNRARWYEHLNHAQQFIETMLAEQKAA